MKPFAQVLDIPQGNKCCYGGFLIPTIEELKGNLKTQKDKLKF